MPTLHDLVYGNQIAELKIALEQGSDPNHTEDFAGVTPLHIAVQNNRIEAVKLLLCAGANAGLPDIDGTTPVHLAQQHGHITLFRLLTVLSFTKFNS